MRHITARHNTARHTAIRHTTRLGVRLAAKLSVSMAALGLATAATGAVPVAALAPASTLSSATLDLATLDLSTLDLASHDPATLSASIAPGDVSLRQSRGQAVRDTLVLSHLDSSLGSGVGGRDAVLDWRTPRRDFTFDLPPADWVEALTLVLRADPLRADRAPALELRLNGGEPIRVEAEPRGVTATVDLPLSDLRPARNRVELGLVADGECLAKGVGGWDIDLARSELQTTSRARSRSVFLGELERFLARPSAKARRFGIQAVGGDTDGWQALVAQGLALRAHTLPEFALGGGGEVDVVVGTREALRGTITDRAILDGSGARLAVHEGRPLRLVLTGDTEADVGRAVEAFASGRLPDVRRRVATPLAASRAQGFDAAPLLERGASMAELGGLDFSRNWGAGADGVAFRVSDPEATRARVEIDFERADFVSDSSTVAVELNGRPLAQATLREAQTRFQATVPQGWLRGHNVLRVVPTLSPAASTDGCAPNARGAGLLARAGRIDLAVDTPSEAGDLSRLAAGSGPLLDARGAGTAFVLPEARAEREAALRLVAQMARASGTGLVEAEYGSDLPQGQDVVVFDADVLGGVAEGANGLPAGFARNLSRSLDRPGSTVALARLDGHWVGVFGTVGELSQTADALSGAAWQDLRGGLSRVAGGEVELVQAAVAGPGIPAAREGGWRLASLPSIDIPSLDIPDLDAGLFQAATPAVSTLRAQWTRVSWNRMVPEVPSRLLDGWNWRRGLARLRGFFAPAKAVRPAAPTLASADHPLFQPWAGLNGTTLQAGFLPMTSVNPVASVDIVPRELERGYRQQVRRARSRLGVRPLNDTSMRRAERRFGPIAVICALIFVACAVALGASENATSGRK